MMPVFYVALGGALGAVLRYGLVQHVVMRLHPSPFPLGTVLVNSLGSFLIGALFAKMLGQNANAAEESVAWLFSENARLLLLTGLLGGFTTFSAFSLDALQLLQRGAGWQALIYIAASVLGSIAACAFGYLLLKA